MKKLSSMFMLLPIYLFMAGCDDVVNNGYVILDVGVKDLLDHTILHQGSVLISSYDKKKRYQVVSSQADYETLLLEYSNDMPVAIDFTSNVVLLIDIGVRGGSDNTLIETVAEYETYVKVYIRNHFPGHNCAVITVLSHSYLFVKIPTNKTLLFDEFIDSSCT